MPLARLDNLLKNLNGNILYVDPAQLDATDSIDNRGNSAIRPFKTIQRALLEAVRFSYVQGSNNDLFDQTTILISPGTHYIDNRPGFYVDGNTIKTYAGSTSSIPELNLQSNFDITDSLNDLYKYNSADGGVIIPRGVSIVASDLRKTKVRPLYVPNPTDSSIPRTALFRLTGACYIYGFTIFDGDPNGNVYSNPTSSIKTPPSYSHHKLTAFEYADGKNKYVKNGVTLDKTDLEMYYYKVAKGYGQNSGIPVIIDWGVNSSPDLYPNIEENRIVGDLGRGTIVISDIIAGDGISQSSNIVTVTTTSEHGLSPFTAILISGVGDNTQQITEYNGSFIVAQVISSTQFTYRLPDSPESTLNPGFTSGITPTVTTVSDTVSSSSPYVFNCSLKSVYGMNGLHADGSKATGFKSIVTAQFTGISLQKDDRAFVLYNESSGTYNDQTSFPNQYLHQNSRSVYKPDWESFHIKASNDAFIQCVSIFAIGYSKHFVADNGGDQSITNSNSNFGAIALSSRGFKDYQLEKDNHAYITHIIPPKDITTEESNIRCLKIDSGLTTSINNPSRIYLDGYDNFLDPPTDIFRKYKVGGKSSERIYIDSDSNFATVSPNYKLEFNISSIDTTNNLITIQETAFTGVSTGIQTSQSVRITSENGLLPDGIESDKIYFINSATVGAASTNIIGISENLSNSTDSNSTALIDIKNTIGVSSGNLKIVSKVSDKSPGDVGSPFQFDFTNNNWYLSIESKQSFVNLLSTISDPVFYIKRFIDSRKSDDKLYRARVVIPKESDKASELSTGFIIQRSSSALTQQFNSSSTLSSFSESRNRSKIIDAWTVSGTPNTCYIVTKYPHKLKVGSKVNIYNLKSSNEPSPVGLGTGTGYNGSYTVSLVINELTFAFQTTKNPGTITTISSSVSTWLDQRNCSSTTYRVAPYTISNISTDLPYFTCEELANDYQVYKINTIQSYSEDVTDGIYYVTLNCFKNIPSLTPFNVTDLKLSQSIEDLYPKVDLDNPNSDPLPTKTIASRKIIGEVLVNDKERSVTKETIVSSFKDFGIGSEISSISKSGSTCVLATTVEHGIRGIRQLSVPGGSSGSGFTNGTWYDIPLCGGSGSGATAQITVSGGAVTSARIINPGSGYINNDTVTIRGIPHSSSNGSSVDLTVSSTHNSDLGLIQILGSLNPNNDGYFPITSVTATTITYTNANGANESNAGSSVIFSGEKLTASSASGTTNTTITCSTRHSIAVGNKVYFSSIASTLFDVISVPSATTFVVSGNASSVNSASDKSFFVVELSPSLRDSNSSSENLLARQYVLRDNIVVRSANNSLGDITSTSSSLSLSATFGFNYGDFIQVDDEIMWIKSISGSSVEIKRGCLGTKATSHTRNTLVKKLNIIPIELRRNSILRASGHTFEYLGFGPGNYSTGMPTNQDRVLTDNEILVSQALPTRGGSVLYTGMNSNGDYFIGRKKFNTLTGEEELLGLSEEESGPITSFDDLTVTNLTVTNTLDASTTSSEFGNITAGIVTATSFNGPLTGNVTGNLSGNVTGNLTGNVSGNVTGNLTGEVNSTSFDTNTSGVVVTGIATATSFVGKGTIPVGGIIMWSGTQSQLDATPEWKLCDGSNGTPDLRNKFVVAANDISKTGTTSQSGTSPYEPGDTGGSADAVVVSHIHKPRPNSSNQTGSFSITNPSGTTTGSYSLTPVAVTTGSASDGQGYASSATTNAYDPTGNVITGESGTNKNLPPYYALAFIMRVS
jgi:hypothetical protein